MYLWSAILATGVISAAVSIADHKYKICDVILGLSKSFDQLVRQKKAA